MPPCSIARQAVHHVVGCRPKIYVEANEALSCQSLRTDRHVAPPCFDPSASSVDGPACVRVRLSALVGLLQVPPIKFLIYSEVRVYV